MTLELLPNELFIQCFTYLNAIDIFHAFDQLNDRFYTLIRSIPLNLNFRNVKKSKFDEFCMRLSLNPEIKQHIYSLTLSNENTCQIYLFLLHFSLADFSHLQSLTLVELQSHNLFQLRAMLPLLSQLSCFRLVGDMIQNRGKSGITFSLP